MFEDVEDIDSKKRRRQEEEEEENPTVLGAYRSGELRLPPGYYLEFDPDVLALRRGERALVHH